jgi:hypothetical protein
MDINNLKKDKTISIRINSEVFKILISMGISKQKLFDDALIKHIEIEAKKKSV